MHPNLVPPAIRSVGWDAPFSGLTAALRPDGTALLGPVADAALASLHGTASSQGLLMMASYRQGADEFAASADMFRLTSRVIKFAAMLLVCNNANAEQAMQLERLRAFQPAPPLRMFIRSRLNMGYYCGELHALSAASPMWRSFAWVLYTSGPDSMLTPSGALALAEWMSSTEDSLQPPTSYLGAPYPSAPGHTRFSMDAFVFWPVRWAPGGAASHTSTPWLNATRWCLHGFGPADAPLRVRQSPSDQKADHPIPEMLLNELRSRFNMTFRDFPGGHGHSAARARLKLAATAPRTNAGGEQHSFWHSHNATAVRAWATQYESTLLAREKRTRRRSTQAGAAR